ncbi:Predicted ATP-dependent endonuclease of the OLD family, contains P-loop ATPase and TOPRIM domains [Streptococcus gallolyticus]|uniref:Predicted ATP-dependent endonuclease of the OLD family, contains P-loop ATPase and TOPRIM domains n=1 Tax=Streptococcus gallolyticus TaxID=315405 RepID=A0A1H7UAI0_9STRE|nr:ATP-binding protein [Streptococcus gallolyticus]SEF19533.1 Predicted ATP-dependent endonuclease of the OLD family, contains P-loop ATPase and TOPRIM domains [Streptococcus gallolyticus]SEL93746.1 Predicted ATP-dependent endonuclease of the OLD family, contains P-loop ATPase and TOPRIM domains [Streptococcus gallolyticus]
MRIKEVQIKQFRSVKEAKFEFNQINAVVGENNAGKTAVLRALNSFFNFENEKESFENRSHQFAARTNSYITISFSLDSTDKYNNQYSMNNCLKIKFVYYYSKQKVEYSIESNNGKKKLTQEEFKKIISPMEFVYIPVERNQMSNGQYIFNTLVQNFLKEYTSNRDNISSEVKKAAKNLHKNVLSKLERKIKKQYLFNTDYNFKIKQSDDINYRVLLDTLEVILETNVGGYPLDKYGSGTQSLATIAMYRANAKLNGKIIVLGIEEPETNLHPQAQKKLINSLSNSLDDNEIQAIFTTHSTVLVDQLNHEDIILARRKKTDTKFITVLTQIKSTFWDNPDIEEFKHYQYFRYKNSDFFFSKYVVVCESKNDCQVIEKLLQEKLKEKIFELSFLNADGKENIKYAYYLLKELQLPFTIIVDRDYFYNYINNSLDSSRDERTGFPKYDFSKVVKRELLKEVFNEERLRNIFGYRKFFEFISKRNFLSMQYCLEMDLLCSSKAREEYYKILEVPKANQNTNYLLTNMKKRIKKIEVFMKVLNSLSSKDLPESYKK